MKKDNVFGKIIIVGRTNVGKSTLVNQLIQSNISIISHKIHTTQTHITGIYTSKNMQLEVIDSPGLQKKYYNYIDKKKIRDTIHLIDESNLVIFLLTCFVWSVQEKKLLKYIQKNNNQCILVINKIDLIDDKKLLLPFILKISSLAPKNEIFLISAKKKTCLEYLISNIKKILPKSNHKYPKYKKTTCKKKFLISEMIRETLIHTLHQELAYSFKIFINEFYQKNNGEYFIFSTILAKNLRHKKIIIGKKGKKIQKCQLHSRYKIEKFLNKKVNLKLKICI
ncbi:GTPase Era [Buchnera aphidicola]|uniref:GTPase Era n=1 Tax=Buchnera aphidicola (Cinara strobi) TaxID=1921549 RepID=A0A3B1E9G1_9GAMM|nr:GTPase Era [Buchnera aphidicola]VAX76489.1 GTPase Era [Buchnera aphidicola (Cinara strobi)]